MEQQELPLAMVRGEAYTALPSDLFIPPDALEVHLEEFEGPLDLLLYLIKKQKFDIADLPIAPISEQYFQYIQQLEYRNINLSADYLVMAATLAYIKSRMLLPKPEVDDEEEDPRAELVRKLQEYQKVKNAAELLDQLPREEREFFVSGLSLDEDSDSADKGFEQVLLADLISAYQQVIKREAAFEHHHIQREAISTHDKIKALLEKLTYYMRPMALVELLDINEGRQGVVVTFLAILELIKSQMIHCLVVGDHIEVSLHD
ncbi:MAG: segregation/condensation protein A [Thalassotalea sp.]|nr:segregation/condensation protein A [Thalassotalea sp.]